MTITQLQYIIAVDKHRHFAKAAEACHVTQPTLSMQIQKLENSLDILIFDRSKHPIIPTPLGERIIKQAKKVIFETGVLEQMAQQIKGNYEGELKLGIIPSVASSLLHRFIPAFVTKYPKIQLVIEELKTEDLIEALRKDTIDVGIAATPLDESGIQESPLYYEPFVAFVPEYHRFYKDAFILSSEIDINDVLLLNEGHCFRNSVIKLCGSDAPSKHNLSMESGNFQTLIQLAHKGMGMTLLPYLTAQDVQKQYKQHLKPVAEPTPGRAVSLIYTRTQLKKEWIEALGGVIKDNLPKKVLSQPDVLIEPTL